ncbi:DUF5996 family protein [Micromonospora chokoriensis]|uniref:DUF5996 family protein n=1 Tax=Micromonospora chokoriensis TaxID=356851 RepID=UPI001E2EF067|nr:DUF5996 family protein [Micromonospora chokoriensis]
MWRSWRRTGPAGGRGLARRGRPRAVLPRRGLRRAGERHHHAAPDPDRAVAEFLRTTYEAAAGLGNWDRSALEDDPLRWHRANTPGGRHS